MTSTRTRPSRLPLAFVLAGLVGCGTPTPGPADPGAVRAPGSTAAAPPPAPAPAADSSFTPPALDLRGQVVLTVAVDSFDALLDQGLAYVQPHLPPAFRVMAQPATLKAQLFGAIQLPGLEQALDTGRPAALALVDPQRHRGRQLGPVIVALPVQDEDRLIQLLGQRADRQERTSHGDHLFSFGSSTIRLRFVEGYALAAEGERLIDGAAGVLLPLVRRTAGPTGRLRVDLVAVERLYGAQVDEAVATLRQRQRQSGIEEASMMQLVGRWLGYLKSTEALTVDLELQQRAVRLRGALEARPSGLFADHLRRQIAGPAWGARLIPADSGLVYLTRQSPAEALRSFDESLPLIAGTLKDLVPAATLDRLRGLLAESARAYSGEVALGLWVNADGGVGLGGAARVKDAAAARGVWLKLAGLLAQELNRVMRALPAETRRSLEGFDLRLTLRPGGLNVAGVRADLLELTPTWPRPGDPRARKELAEIKQRVTRALGSKLTLALVHQGELALLAAGKDHRQRLAQLLAAARGGAGGGMEAAIQAHVAGKQIVDVLHVPVAILVEQGMRLADRLTSVPAQVKDVFHKVMPAAGKVVPVTGALHVVGSRLVLDVEISPDLLGMIARGVLAALSARGGGMIPSPAGP